MSMWRILPTGLRRAGATILVLLLAAVPPAAANDAEKAAQFIRDLGNRAITELADESVPYEARVKRFRELVDDGFAMDAISRFVLGRYWRAASDAEKKEFRETFLRVITQRFLPLFEGYTKDDFVVQKGQPDPRSPDFFLVTSRVAQPDGSGMVKAGWRVTPRDGQFKIVDVLAEGVSMAITLRSEYTSVIQRNGGQVSVLIDRLQENVKKGAYSPDTVGDAVQ